MTRLSLGPPTVRFFLLAVLCSTVALGAEAPVKLGVIAPSSGKEAAIGSLFLEGVKLAQDELTADGAKLELVIVDDKSDAKAAAAAVQGLALKPDVAAILGPVFSYAASSAAPVAQKLKVPLVLPAASEQGITRQGYDWVFRICGTNLQFVQGLLLTATTLGKPKTLVHLYEDGDFGKSTNKAVREVAATKQLTVLAEEPYSGAAPKLGPALQRIKALDPDLILMSSLSADAIAVMEQVREAGLEPQAFMGMGGGFALPAFAERRELSEQVFVSTQWSPRAGSPEERHAFSKKFADRFGHEPTYHAAMAYAGLKLLYDAATKSKGKRAELRRVLKEGTWSGVAGDINFEDFEGFTNQNAHAVAVQQALDGKLYTVFPPKAMERRPIFPFSQPASP